jgi:hypothetical protein
MRIKLIVALVVLALLPIAFAQQVVQPACDRACLEKYIDRYMDAMLAHDPSSALFARDCKFTENGVRLPLGGEGLWFGMSGKGTYQFYIPDVETQQIAFIGTAREGVSNSVVAIALRLKILNGLISEAEQLVIRPESNPMGGSGPSFPPTGVSVEKLGSPHAIYSEVIPEAERPSREEMIKTANYYFSGMQKNDGKGYYPFTDDCHRLENGMPSTNVPLKPGEARPDPKTAKMYSAAWGCKEQFESGLLNFVTRIRDRRFVAVDRERGIVFAFGFFDHVAIDWTWQIAELFKVEKGKIRRIEAVFHRCPYGMNSGWSTYEQGMSDQIQSVR